MKNINTYLPVFPGFYGSIFEADEAMEIECINDVREEKGLDPIDYEDCEFDYEDYRLNVSKECVNAVEDRLRELIDGKITLTFQELISPRFYNFSTDGINIGIELDAEARKSIVKILKENENDFNKHIKENYSSRDGFISHHSNIGAEWIEAVKSWNNDLLKHKLGAVLGFILELDEYDAYSLSADIETHNVFATNYNELIGE